MINANNLKEWLENQWAKIYRDFGVKKIQSGIEKAILEDNPKGLELAMKNAREIGFSVNEVDALTIRNAKNGIYISWKLSLILNRSLNILRYALSNELIKPGDEIQIDHAVVSQKYTFKSCCWMTSGSDIREIWTEAATKKQAAWKRHDHCMHKLSLDESGLSWLKGMFLSSIVFLDDIAKNKKMLRSTVIRNGVVEMSVWDLTGKIKKRGVDLGREAKHSSIKHGPSAETYKAFVQLGWCSMEDIQKFNAWVLDFEQSVDSGRGHVWHRKELESWIEAEMLKGDVGLGGESKNKKMIAL